jgi:hypothetical protein
VQYGPAMNCSTPRTTSPSSGFVFVTYISASLA